MDIYESSDNKVMEGLNALCTCFLDFVCHHPSRSFTACHWISVSIPCCIYRASFDAFRCCSAFFSLLVSLFLPPNMPVQVFVFVRLGTVWAVLVNSHQYFQSISTLLVGILFGWGIGAAAMRAAIASRSQSRLQAAGAQLQARYWCNFLLSSYKH